MNITTLHKDILSSMTIDGNKTTITGTLERKTYQEINEIIETLGGKWSRKDKAHVWNCNPSDKLNQILNPQTKTVTTSFESAKEKKKAFQFFGTPDAVADMLMEHASYRFPYAAPDTILEPSAGQGSLVKAVNRVWTNAKVDCFELMPENQEVLKTVPNVNILGDDFLKFNGGNKYQLIIANPPFNKHQDITHIQRMYDMLDDNGVIVSICGHHSFYASHKIDVQFRDWLAKLDYEEYEIDPGEFKQSGTMVGCKLLVIQR